MGFVYFDLTVSKEETGRVVFELFEEDAPKICEEFNIICEEKKSLVGVKFNKVIKNFMLLATSQDSIDLKCNEENKGVIENAFLLCVSHLNPFSFFITLESSPHLNNKHTIIGKVIHGKSIIRYLERVPVVSNKQNDLNAWVPINEIEITATGSWSQSDSLPNTIACTEIINGDIFEEWPDDNVEIPNVDFNSPESSFAVIEIIKSAGTTLLKSKRLNDALFKYQKAVRYCNELLPDNHNNKEWHDKFLEMKMTIFLNITLVTLNSGKLKLCKDYCQFILDMDGVKLSSTQVSKVFYRMAKSQMGLKQPNAALETLEKAHMILPDDTIIIKELSLVEEAVLNLKNEEKARYAKFFS